MNHYIILKKIGIKMDYNNTCPFCGVILNLYDRMQDIYDFDNNYLELEMKCDTCLQKFHLVYELINIKKPQIPIV